MDSPSDPTLPGSPGASRPPGRRPKLLDEVRHAVRARQFSRRTEEAYVGWIRRYIKHHGVRHRAEMGVTEVTAFLSHLANEQSLSPSTQR